MLTGRDFHHRLASLRERSSAALPLAEAPGYALALVTHAMVLVALFRLGEEVGWLDPSVEPALVERLKNLEDGK